MVVIQKGDKDFSKVPTIKYKALRLNLNEYIYGSFSEIGAGQETVRNFFRAGGASGTIAKAMSAYDKVFSDAIYGAEDDKRYVTEERLKKMLIHETNLLEERLCREEHPNKIFFSYANTVTTIDFAKKMKGHGWIGIKFQLDPKEAYNEIILHIRFKENDIHLQQETLGKLGTNLIYGAYYLYDNTKDLLLSLYDNIDKDKIEIDMINFSGLIFNDIDNRLMSLYLVKYGMSNAVMFDSERNTLLPAQELYKKNILAFRGSFRPVTKVNIDIYKKSEMIFYKEKRVNPAQSMILFEITLSNLRSMKDGEIDERDFLDRAELLCFLGHNVLITNFKEYYKLVNYLSEFTKARMALGMGIYNLIQIFDEKYYQNLSGGTLEAFGKLFYKDLKIYLYPLKNHKTGELMTTDNIKIPTRMKELFNYFKQNGRLVDIKNFDPSILDILSREVYKMINDDEKAWEEMLPVGIPEIIKEKQLFGYTKK